MSLRKSEMEIQEKYSGISYDELVEIAQSSKMSNLEFIIAQPQLFEEFKEYMDDHGFEEYDEDIASQFISYQEECLTSANQELNKDYEY